MNEIPIMGADATRESEALRSSVDGILERFAATCGSGASLRQVRELTDELLLDLIAALRNASLAEIALTVGDLERRRKSRGGARSAAARTARQAALARVKAAPQSAAGASHASPEPARESIGPTRRDPFDITKPGELLGPGAPLDPRRDEVPPSSAVSPVSSREVRSPRPVRVKTAASGREPAVAAEERSPTVPLREGEQLLRAGGSGVVIRRARIA